MQFEGRIHEQVLPSIRRANGIVQWTDIYVVRADRSHAGRQKRIERDLRLLQLDLADRPDHPFVLFNFGVTLAQVGDHDQAVFYLSRAILLAGQDESHVRKAYALLVKSLMELGRIDAAYEVCRKGRELFVNDLELAFHHGLVAHRLNRLEEARDAYRAALQKNETRHFSSVGPSVSAFKARHNLALVYQDLGEATFAEQEWRIVTDTVPDFQPAWRGLGKVLIKQKKISEASQLAERLCATQRLRSDGLLLKAEIAAKDGQPEGQKEYLVRAHQEFPEQDSVADAYCQFLFENGPTDEAESYLSQLLIKCPNDPAVLQNLGVIHLRLRHYRDAISRLGESLRIRPNSIPARRYFSQALWDLNVREDLHFTLREKRESMPGLTHNFRALVTFATREFQSRQGALSLSAVRSSQCDRVFAWTHKHLRETDFFHRHSAILTLKRGAGYWLWKPYIILDALKRVPIGAFVIYSDCGRERQSRRFDASVERLCEWCALHDGMLPGVYIPEHGPSSRWTKRDCFILMGCDEPTYWQHCQVQASFSVWQNCSRTVEFVEEWLELCTDPRILTDVENTCGFPNFDDFCEHRHDQSVLSLLTLKRGIQALGNVEVQLGRTVNNKDFCEVANCDDFFCSDRSPKVLVTSELC